MRSICVRQASISLRRHHAARYAPDEERLTTQGVLLAYSIGMDSDEITLIWCKMSKPARCCETGTWMHRSRFLDGNVPLRNCGDQVS